MKKLFDPMFWARALRNPIVWLGLIVDLLPIFAVLAWGWNATPLVLLYWSENVIAGVMTLPRIFISGARLGAIGLGLGLFMCAFFVFHYGLFCTVHGIFLMVFVGMSQGSVNADVAVDLPQAIPTIFSFTLQSAPHVWVVLAAIAGFQVLVFFWEFIIKGGWKETNPMAEMFAPYSRIVVMHIGIFAGAAALFLLGQPMVGVLALILLRAAWGVLNNGKGNDPFDVGADAGSSNAFAELEKQIEDARARKGPKA